MYTELKAHLPVTVPQGKGRAIGVIDYSAEDHLLWVTVIDATGEIWAVPNPDVRVRPNPSLSAARTAPGEKP